MPKSTGKTDLNKEITRLEALLREDPESQQFYLLADAYTRSGRFMDAINVCQEGLKRHPQLAEGYVAQGRALFGTGKLNKAIRVLRKAILLPRSGAEPYRLLGEILLRKDAGTEAVTLLEEAVERGITERAIVNLLERARQAMEQEKTNVVELPGAAPRGIGNIAVAGTIGTTGEIEVSEVPGETTTPRLDPSGPQPPPLPPGATGRGAPKRRPSSPDWSILDAEWEQELDARNTGGFADLDSDVGGPFERRRMEIAIPPLTDPLAEGMPPLPLEPEESGPTLLPGEQRLYDEEDEDSKTQPLEVVAADGGARDDEEDDDDEPQTSPVIPIALAKTLLSPVPVVAATPVVEQEAAAPEEPKRAEPSGEQRAIAEVEAVQFEDLMAWPPTDGSPEASSAGEADAEEQPAPEEEELPYSVEYVAEPEPAPEGRRGRRGLWMLVVFLLFSAAGGAAVYLWRHKLATGREVEQARLARVDGSFAALDHAARMLARHKSRSGQMAAEAEAVGALRWFHYAHDKAPAVTPSHDPWGYVLARALVQLAGGERNRARSLLEPEPPSPPDRAFRTLYLAWIDWIDGQRAQAEERLGKALELEPKLANALLLQGHLGRETGELGQAEQLYRRALQVSPRHELAACALAAVLLEQGKETNAEVEKLLTRPTASPVVKAWLGLLKGERKLREGDAEAGSQEIQSALAVAPSRAALLFQGVRSLIGAGQLDAALVTWERLRQVRPGKDLAVALMQAELALAQGLDQAALDQLKGSELPLKGKLLMAEALLRTGKPEEVARLLADEDAQEAKVYEAAAASRAQPAALDELKRLAGESPRARLALARALFSKGELAGAVGEVRGLVKGPPVKLDAMVLLAEIQVAQSDLAAAFATLDAVRRISGSRHLPAGELMGRLYVELGRFPDAAKLLGEVLRAGRRSLPLTVALAKAEAMAGRAMEAASALDEAKALGATPAQLEALTGFVRLAQGRFDEAETLLGRHQDGVVNLVALGRASMEAGQTAAAEKALARAIKESPVSPLPHLWLGQLHLQTLNPRGVAHFTTAIQRAEKRAYFPRSVIAEASIGLARYKMNKMSKRRTDPEVIKHLQLAARVDPANATVYALMGEAYIAQRRHRKAAAALEKCVELDPENANAYFLLGTAVKMSPARAVHALKRFLELEPKGKRATVARRRLARLQVR